MSKEGSKSPLKEVFNAFILFTAATCANTNLYVASRTLFGVAKGMSSPKSTPRAIAFFGKTDNNRVPQRAVWISVFAFSWVPFLQIPGDLKRDSKFGWAVEILVRSGSVSMIIVWTCQCLAYIRYYRCISRHKSALEGLLPQLRNGKRMRRYPYCHHFQPGLAWVVLAACLYILLFCNSAILWKRFHTVPFLSSYLPISGTTREYIS